MSCIGINEYHRLTGAPIPIDPDGWAELESALKLAEAIIDAATLYGYVGGVMVPPYIARKYEETVAFQALYITQIGGVEDFNNLDLSNVSLGKFSYSRGGTGTGRTGGSDSGSSALPISPIAASNIPLLRAYVRTIWKGVTPDAPDPPGPSNPPCCAQASDGD